ncbi:DNA oxidative demethylase [Lachnellula occidentalis]|uniref:DNA oxidative demethylase n=1 Tax=Lachnellula occidentalis TaxID=215460 RepID=A0A8H8UC52_9HELO|nr:DNA oxidative demethylase [Lachnellula occidentalis]
MSLLLPEMFEINQQNIPFVRTRQALLVLDPQNDFVSTGGLLPVETPPDFLEKILELVPAFRESGNRIIWIQSVFEASRAINENQGDSESVITDEQLLVPHRRSGVRDPGPRGPPPKLLELQRKIALSNGRALQSSDDFEADDGADVDEIQETFLTIPEGQTPRVAIPSSLGSNFTNAVRLAIDCDKDLIFTKSYYSAFRDGALVQVLRAQFVTEIFLVGCLTNISVFATAMDAAQYGYAITIIEDGLGYRSKARHDEALRKLTEATGCDIVQSEEIIGDLQRKQVVQQPIPPQKNPRRRENGGNLEGLMANLNLRPDGSSNTKPPAKSIGPPVIVPAENGGAESVAACGSPPAQAEVEGKKRERVKTRIKTRRRHSKSRTKAIGSDGDKHPSNSENGRVSPVSATLHGVSEILEKMPKIEDAEVSPRTLTPVPDASSESASIVYTEAPTVEIEINETNGKQPGHHSSGSSYENHFNASDIVAPTTICEGDTTVIENLLNEELVEGVFERLRDEVRWQKMSHLGGDVPRLVAVQGEVAEDGSIPVYRHPSDESPPLLPFSPTVSLIQARVEESLGHPVNHVLIQFYRDGLDYISEHSDKTLDIVPKTYIANVSLGAQRTMVFRTKRLPKNPDDQEVSAALAPRQSCRAPLPHNSMCKVGLVTNMRWLHSVRQDKRMTSEKSPEELAFDGGRISLTFRQIGTFLDKDEFKIWGQGAVAKLKTEARAVINGETDESNKMLKAFGKENQTAEFDWAESYGQGFDVLHISNSPKLFMSGDAVADLRVKLSLARWDISWTEGKLSPSFNWKESNSSNDASPVPEHLPVKFVDTDSSKSTITGDLAVMLYLDSVYGQNSEPRSQADLARQFTRLQQCGELLNTWRAEPFSVKAFKRELELCDAYAAEAEFIAGSTISIADFALWPILNEISIEWPGFEGNENLTKYFEFMKKQDCVVRGAGLAKGKVFLKDAT